MSDSKQQQQLQEEIIEEEVIDDDDMIEEEVVDYDEDFLEEEVMDDHYGDMVEEEVVDDDEYMEEEVVMDDPHHVPGRTMSRGLSSRKSTSNRAVGHGHSDTSGLSSTSSPSTQAVDKYTTVTPVPDEVTTSEATSVPDATRLVAQTSEFTTTTLSSSDSAPETQAAESTPPLRGTIVSETTSSTVSVSAPVLVSETVQVVSASGEVLQSSVATPESTTSVDDNGVPALATTTAVRSSRIPAVDMIPDPSPISSPYRSSAASVGGRSVASYGASSRAPLDDSLMEEDGEPSERPYPIYAEDDDSSIQEIAAVAAAAKLRPTVFLSPVPETSSNETPSVVHDATAASVTRIQPATCPMPETPPTTKPAAVAPDNIQNMVPELPMDGPADHTDHFYDAEHEHVDEPSIMANDAPTWTSAGDDDEREPGGAMGQRNDPLMGLMAAGTVATGAVAAHQIHEENEQGEIVSTYPLSDASERSFQEPGTPSEAVAPTVVALSSSVPPSYSYDEEEDVVGQPIFSEAPRNNNSMPSESEDMQFSGVKEKPNETAETVEMLDFDDDHDEIFSDEIDTSGHVKRHDRPIDVDYNDYNEDHNTPADDVEVIFEDEPKKEGEMNHNKSRKRDRTWVFVLLGVLVLAGIAVLLYFLIQDDDSDVSRDIPMPTTSPAPSVAPTMEIRSYATTAGPFDADSRAIALTDEFMVAGHISNETENLVQVYRSIDGSWDLFSEISDPSGPGSNFGVSVDLVGNALLIGATGVPILGTSVLAGAAYYYSFMSSTETWEPLGTVIVGANGTDDIGVVNQRFGHSVGVSATERIVVGAPDTSIAAQEAQAAGRVYTYKYDQVSPDSPLLDWVEMQNKSIVGNAANDRFGYAVDISADGTRFAAGAPGDGNGYVNIYQWSGSQWDMAFSFEGEENEALGSSVTFLSGDGSSFAVGGPDYGDDQGRIRVFAETQATTSRLRHGRRSQALTFVQLEPAIVGSRGERLGGERSLAGSSMGSESVSVVATTAIGTAERFDRDFEDASWKQRFFTIDSPASAGSSVAVGSSADTLAIIGGGSVSVFSVLESGSGPAPTPDNPSPTPDNPSPAPMVRGQEVTAAPTTLPENSTSTILLQPTLRPSYITDELYSWVVAGGPFVGPESVQYGSVLGMSPTLMAAGAPGVTGGTVLLYQLSNGTWEALNPIVGDEDQSRFGSAVAVAESQVVVGAPGQLGEGISQEIGAVFVYSITADGRAERAGDILRGDGNVTEVGESFGAAVGASASSVGRVVVGAPGSNYAGEVQVGRVYIFERAESNWTRMETSALIGVAPEGQYGIAVSMAEDGGRFVVGSAANYIDVYEWDSESLEWTVVFTQDGDGDESFGSSVVMINEEGTLLAVGSPNFDGGRGAIRVFEDQGRGYVQIGPDIVGDDGDFLGLPNSISASGSTPHVVAASATGMIKRFDFDREEDQWVQLYFEVPLGYKRGIRGVAATSNGETFVVGGDDTTQIFNSYVVLGV